MRKGIVVLILCIFSVYVFGQRTITGNTGTLDINKIYLCEVVHEYRGIHQVIDSAEVKNGQFTFVVKDARPELYFIGDTPWHGGYFFLDGNKIKLKPESISEEQIDWSVEGSPLDKKYREFKKRMYAETFGAIKDSLNALFYKAREAGNREEMKRIKEESEPYYDEGSERERELVKEYVQKNMENPFGMYLYYYNVFQRKDFPTLESIVSEKAYIDSFGKDAKNTSYLPKMGQKLDLYENCAIGHEAPEIVGLDTLGNPVKLSDFRGNYVLVDFWNSYCHWCREETPALLKALKQFKGKNFKILGVSSDRYKDKWIEAIHEDGSYWEHLMLEKGDDVMERYCIKGIPHIILVSPDGKILAKELRGEELVRVPEELMRF
ncbi:TlpA disulfide reductase family protein [Butyricimonas hominis]|jgi:thiol:disulfide interchange protein|uniref:AhpC/TSA family protein n=1 Tax=Butyricimonas hominis TaxID=2763032 RepID=A0ABR7D854_9BACT|nr:TlpA disulfide reductase family protein [Butyricimonas hominis]MBC5623520.1 AhpC/TSA family protein [Butyricimonas hominis]